MGLLEQLLSILTAFIIYFLLILNIPLIILQCISEFDPDAYNSFKLKLNSYIYGRIFLFSIKFAFVVNLIITILLFYFFTWEFLAQAF